MATAAMGLVLGATAQDARAFACDPCPTDDALEAAMTSRAHNCGSRHMLVAHRKGDVIVRLATDNGTHEGDERGTEMFEKP